MRKNYIAFVIIDNIDEKATVSTVLSNEALRLVGYMRYALVLSNFLLQK